MNAEEVRIAANALKEKWGLRNNKFKAWYDIILQVDELKQDDMESAVTNEARSLYNLALTMLSQDIPHRIPIDKLSPEDIEATSTIEDFLTTVWRSTQRRYRRRGEQSAYDTLIKYVLITGWYSIFSPIWEDGLAVEVWNPAEVFPDYGEDGLTAVVHVYSLIGKKALERAKVKGWSTPTNITPKQMIVVTDYWYIEDGQAHNAVLFDREAVKPDTTEAFTEIPIFTGPVAGLPDKGTITDNINFQEHFGESIVATNEKLYKLYNKQWTFALQLLRDTANPRWFEQSAGGEAIINPADLFKRGAVFRGGIQDSINPLPVPALPVELRTDRFDVQQMLQRGGVSFAAYGSAMTAMSGYLMSQITSSVKSATKGYSTT